MKVSRFLSLSLLIVLVSVSAIAQEIPAPVIESIEPAIAPTSGGTAVTITGRNLDVPPNVACLLPCPTLVSFGGIDVEPRFFSQTRLVVAAPPHDAGRVDVTVKTGDGRRVTATNAFQYSSSGQAGYETLLLPIYLDGTVDGGSGSQWRTDLWLRNNGDLSVQLAPWPCPVDTPCPAVFPNTKPLAPNESLHNLTPFFRPPSANPGKLLYVTRSGADYVSANLRVFDVSRESSNAGTELPVVRDADLLTTKTSLLNVPADNRFRQHLRIYDTALTSARFRVNIYAQQQGTSSGAPITSVELMATTEQTGEFRDQPAFAQIPDIAAIIPIDVNLTAIRVEIEPLTSGSRYWGFVSVTNNVSQHVTIVTPQ